MKYRTACTNCGESNYHVESNISFITGFPGFHVCNNCGFTAKIFPKLSEKELSKLKKEFSKKPKTHFREQSNSKNWLYFLIIILILLAVASVPIWL